MQINSLNHNIVAEFTNIESKNCTAPQIEQNIMSGANAQTYPQQQSHSSQANELEKNFNNKVETLTLEERHIKNPFLKTICEQLFSKPVIECPWLISSGGNNLNYPHYFYKAWKMKVPLKDLFKELFYPNFNTKLRVVIQNPAEIQRIEQKEKKEAEIRELDERARLRILAEKSLNQEPSKLT